MKNSIAKTYRLPAGICSLISNEAEILKTSDADVVRLALRHYFEDRQAQEHLGFTEQRIIERIDAQGQRLGQLIGQILSMAQPQ
ncbi:MAG: hypothetical protein WC100_13445 [Sterolibacterium sp.]